MENLSREEGLLPLDPDASHRRDYDRPIINIGRLAAEPGQTVSPHLVLYPIMSGGFYDAVLKGGGVGAGISDFSGSYFGVAGGGSGSGTGPYVRVVVPPNTSVVTLSSGPDGSMWQRPVAGWALFPVLSEDARFTVEAYDELGNQIGSWDTG